MERSELSHSRAGTVPRALGKWKRRSEVETEIRVLIALPMDEFKVRLHQCIAGAAPISGEALIYLVRAAIADTDPTLLNLAFEALSKLVTPTLLKDAWRLLQGERLEHPQEVLTRVYAAAKQDGAAIDYAEVNFNDYLKRRSIERLRERKNDSKVVNSRLNPTDEYNLLEITVPAREASPECRGLIQIAIARLPLKLREVFLQFHYLGLTQAEIAQQHDVDPRTIRNWLAKAKEILGISGDEHDV